MRHVEIDLSDVLPSLTGARRTAVNDAVHRGYATAYENAILGPPEQLVSRLGYFRWLEVDAELAALVLPDVVTGWRKITGTGVHYATVEADDRMLLTAKTSSRGVRLVGDAGYRLEGAQQMNVQPTIFDAALGPEFGIIRVQRAYGIVLHGTYERGVLADAPDFIAVAFPDFLFSRYLQVEFLKGDPAFQVEPKSLIATPVKEEVQQWLVRRKRSNDK